MKIKYKVLQESDIPLIKDLVVEGFRQFSAESIKNFINTSNTYAFVALDTAKIVGLCYGYVLTRPDQDAANFYIRSLGVSESFRNKGIGSELLNFSISYAFENLGCCECYLTSCKGNAHARHIYEKSGGKINEGEVVYVFKRE